MLYRILPHSLLRGTETNIPSYVTAPERLNAACSVVSCLAATLNANIKQLEFDTSEKYNDLLNSSKKNLKEEQSSAAAITKEKEQLLMALNEKDASLEKIQDEQTRLKELYDTLLGKASGEKQEKT